MEANQLPLLTQPEILDLSKFDLTVANIKHASVAFVVKKTELEISKESLSLDQVKALYFRSLEERSQTKLIDLEYPNDGSNYDTTLSSLEIAGVNDFPFDSGILTPVERVAHKAIETLSPEDQYEIARLIIDNYKYLDDYNHTVSSGSLFEVFKKSEKYDEIIEYCFDKIQENKSEYRYKVSEKYYPRLGWVSDLVADLSYYTNGEWLPKLIYEIENEEYSKLMLGIFVDSMTFPKVINLIRDHLDKTGDKKCLEVGRILVGADPKDDTVDFFTSVSQIYKLIDFENYPTNEALFEFEIDLIMNHIKDGDVILEKGCGTGRLSNEIAKRCLTKGLSVKVVAFDSSQENVKKAKEADTTRVVEYHVWDWEKIEMDEESVDLVIDLGRNNTHAENHRGLQRALDEPRRVCKTGGLILGDWPDPNKGEYLENKIKYLRLLQNLHMPIDPTNKESTQNFDYVIDGPIKDNGNYKYVYNRYAPQIGNMVAIYEDSGFSAKFLASKKIEGWKNSVNLYFSYTKI